MVDFASARQWIGSLPMLRLDLIRHDIPEHDVEWFARCRIHQFLLFPWLGGDTARSVLALLLLRGAAPVVFWPVAISLLLLVCGEWLFLRHLVRELGAARQRVRQIAKFMLVRAAVWALVLSTLIIDAGLDIGTVMLFAMAAVLFDILCTVALPITGTVAAGAMIVSIAGALVLNARTDLPMLVTIVVAALAGVHYGLFNLHYLFATRRLRTRSLRMANETIQSLLSHYDEHGTDSLIEVDSKGRLQNPSARLCELLQRSPEALDGIPVSDIFEPGRECNALLAAARRNHRFRNCLVPVRVAGERRWWSISGCALFDADGRHDGYRCFAQDVTEKHEAEEKVRRMATRDILTGLMNRAVFTSHLADAVARCSPVRSCAVLFLDLDSFKLVNDTHGHAAGDAVLVEAARRIEDLLPAHAVAARLGGDEFAVLIRNVTDYRLVEHTGRAIVEALGAPMTHEGRTLSCAASVGMAIGPEHGGDGETLLQAADVALYQAKSHGRGTAALYHPSLLNDLRERRSLEADLALALERGEFALHYQPLVDIATRRTIGYEALLRWQHPERGAVPPSLFIPVAEETGLITAIGEWVLREALVEAATWRDDLTVAVNVSPAQMRGEALLSQVVSALANAGVSPHRLELEITESLLMRECDVQLRMLHRLRAFGVRIALDDFGTGYSSLNYLRRFPFDKLKIDRSFVSEIERPDSRAIIETVLNLAREFRMETIAEGVESEAQFARLKALGCEQAQGFLFDKAMPAARIPPDQRRPAAIPTQDLEPGGWLRAHGIAAVPSEAGYCKTSCRKC